MPRALARWEPFAELLELRTRLDRMFDQWHFLEGPDRAWIPAIGVVREDGSMVVRADVPGRSLAVACRAALNRCLRDNTKLTSGLQAFWETTDKLRVCAPGPVDWTRDLRCMGWSRSWSVVSALPMDELMRGPRRPSGRSE